MMHCVECGSPLEDDADFCPSCGTPVSSAARSVAQASVQTKPSSRAKILPVALLAIVAIAALAFAAGMGVTRLTDGGKDASAPAASEETRASGEGEGQQPAPTNSVVVVTSDDDDAADEEPAADESSPQQVSVESAPEPEPEPEPEVYTSPCIRIVMPGKYVAMGCAWITSDHYMALEYFDMTSGSRILIASIPWDERSQIPYEVKEERYDLGKVTDGGVVSDAVLHISYVDDEGKTIYGGLDTVSDTLACEYYLGCSPEEIISWIEVNGDQTPAPPEDPSIYGLSSRTTPFWGVWAFASKDLGEAQGFAYDAIDRGFAAEVFLTTDWSNLNSEPWYVVSLGCVSSEGEADAVLSRAHGGAYPDAYEKYSGDYIG